MELLSSICPFGGPLKVLLYSFAASLPILLLFEPSATWIREIFSLLPLGVVHPSPRSHAILNIDGVQSMELFLKSMSRTAKRNLNLKDLTKHLGTADLKITTCKSLAERSFLFEYAQVIWAHERRYHSLFKSIVITIPRAFSAWMMVGVVDEFRIDGKLMAWGQSIVKGDTLRAMWFYQRPEVSRSNIWFACVRLATLRGIAMEEVKWVDLGPSSGGSIEDLKSRMGFEITSEWPQKCDLQGRYAHYTPDAYVLKNTEIV